MTAVPATCAPDVFECPDGFLIRDTCPKDSCAFGGSCCDRVTGHVPGRACLPSGLLAECAPGTSPTGTSCIADGLGVTDCWDLDQSECVGAADECRSQSREGGGVRCFCLPADDGRTVWSCSNDGR